MRRKYLNWCTSFVDVSLWYMHVTDAKILRDHIKSSTSPIKGNFCQRGGGGLGGHVILFQRSLHLREGGSGDKRQKFPFFGDLELLTWSLRNLPCYARCHHVMMSQFLNFLEQECSRQIRSRFTHLYDINRPRSSNISHFGARKNDRWR